MNRSGSARRFALDEDSTMETERDRLIRQKAYQLWEEGGRRDDSAHEDWAEAERSLDLSPRGEAAPAEAGSKAGGTAGADKPAAKSPPAKPAAAAKPASAAKPAPAKGGPKGRGKTPPPSP